MSWWEFSIFESSSTVSLQNQRVHRTQLFLFRILSLFFRIGSQSIFLRNPSIIYSNKIYNLNLCPTFFSTGTNGEKG
uniref:Uncharacterized protein n=1 Tax=Salix viminalis TaxID=40686 RepID=A0A6N2MAF6_SALVM